MDPKFFDDFFDLYETKDLFLVSSLLSLVRLRVFFGFQLF